MRGGRAGFFTPAALESGRGLPAGAPSPAAASPGLELSWARPGPQSFSRELTQALREGDYAALGPGFAELRPRSPLLPAGRLALFDEVPAITRSGGIYGRGFIRSEARVDPDSWCLVSHFPGDEVMPGTLMYDAALQTLRLYLLTLGWVTPNPQAVWQPPLMTAQSLKCRGQVTPRTRQVAYEIHPREFQISPGPDREPIALAEAIMWADGRPIAEVRNLGLRLAGVPVEELAERWRAYYQKKSPAQVSPAKKPGPRPSARAASLPPPSTRRPVKTGQLFDKERLNTLISGRMSAALGPLFSRFDEGAHVARLPRAPYDFLDQAEVTQGQVGQVALKTSVTASWNPLAPGREWLLSQAGGQSPSLPYAALNEIALQACGFLSAYMGVALLFDEAMYFRNLGGEATVTREIGAPQEPLVTRATLTKTSTLGQMAIQRYDFATSLGSRVVYEGQTNFGFFSLESLQRQRGLQADSALLGALKPPAHPQTRPYPQGPAWPRGRWLMLEELQEADPRRLWAQSRINPQAWFFAAHFPGDPVWPGSLGLEAFFQAAKYLAVKRYFNGQPEEYAGSFAAPSPGRAHSWLYRGQIPPSSLKMGLGLLVSKTDPHNRALTFNGLMSVDDLVVYQVDNFTVALR
ncbi:MAG: hypothetical protein LBR11_05770 [Deltaproteobacteria bacterium]|nr:hypothetical protein [Deltaproteobacteria bacterium]